MGNASSSVAEGRRGGCLLTNLALGTLFTILPLLLGAAWLFLATIAPAGAAGNKARGEFYARENCSTCHAVAPVEGSPYPLAPPFRTLHKKYDVEGLAEALVEGIAVGNTGVREMPMFVSSVDEIDDPIAYLKSLEPATIR
jgi:cytochrome c